MQDSKLYLKIVLNFIFAGLALVALIYFVPQLIRFFLPLIIGWIIALIANPLVQLMEKRIKIVRKHGSAIVIILTLAVVAGLLYLVIGALLRQLVEFVTDLPELYLKIEGTLQMAGEKLDSIFTMMPDWIQNSLNKFSDNIGVYISGFIGKMETPSLNDAGALAKNTAKFFFMLIITILSSYFFIADRNRITAAVSRHMPEAVLRSYHMIVDNLKKAVGGYFKAQFKIMILITVILFVGFEILRIDYSFLLALLVAFLDLLPVFGTGTVIWPWALIDLITGNYFRAVSLLVIYLVCQVVKQLLQPKMVGDSIGISPLQTLLFMFIGFQIGGILGLIIGIPVGMVLINFYKSGVFDRFIRGFKILANALNQYLKF